MVDKPLDSRHYDRLLRQHEATIRKACQSFINARPSLRDDYLQVANIAAYEALQKFEPGVGTIKAFIIQRVKWRCRTFYNESRIGAIATPGHNVGDNLPQVVSYDALEGDVIAAPAEEEGYRDPAAIQKFLAYIEDRPKVHAYAMLAFADATAPEIQERLGLDARQRDLLQQSFKYWLKKYFNLDPKYKAKRPRTEEQRLSKRSPNGCKKSRSKHGRRQASEPNPHRKKPVYQPRLSPWRLEQEGKEQEILRFAIFRRTRRVD